LGEKASERPFATFSRARGPTSRSWSQAVDWNTWENPSKKAAIFSFSAGVSPLECRAVVILDRH
jgi:hypothetical protein